MKVFSEHCLGDGRVFEICFLGVLHSVFQMGGVASENIISVLTYSLYMSPFCVSGMLL